MKIRILAVGKLKNSPLLDQFDEYVKRMNWERLFSLCLLWSLLSFTKLGVACQTIPELTDSAEPVTIKVANNYFQVPEKYLTEPFSRVSGEKDAIEFYEVPLNQAQAPVTFSIWRTTGTVFGKDTMFKDLPHFNDDIVVRIDSYGLGDRTREAIAYLKTISSQEPPKGWEEDTRLATTLGAGQSPCSNNTRRDMEQLHPSSADILKGVLHKNEGIRLAAAQAVLTSDFLNDHEIRLRLERLSTSDNSSSVRWAAIMSLGRIAQNDPSVVSPLIKIMLSDKDPYIRNSAPSVLADAGPAFIEQVIPLIPSSDTGARQSIGGALAWFIIKEVRKDHLESYSQLSPSAKTALGGIVDILRTTSDTQVRLALIGLLENSGEAVASPAYIGVLKTICEDPHLMPSCSSALSALGAGAENIPILMKRLEQSSDTHEIKSLISSIGAFKAAAKDAVPLLVKYVSYRKDVAIKSQNDETVRWAAIYALEEININTPEVVAALTSAVANEEGNTKAQAETALHEISCYRIPFTGHYVCP